MRIETALRRYLIQRQASGVSPLTIDQLQRHIGLLVSWAGALSLEDLAHEELAEFLTSDFACLKADGTPKSPASLNALRSSMRSFGAYCHCAGYSSRNFAALVQRARIGPRAPRPVSAANVERVLAAMAAEDSPAARRDHALFSTMALTGIRITAALGATTIDLDLEAGTLHLNRTKGGGSRTVELPARLRFLLRGWVDELDPGPLFPARHGRVMGRRQAAQRLELWCRRASVVPALAPHDLRRCYARRLFERTHDLLEVQRALGHRAVSSTARYATGAVLCTLFKSQLPFKMC